MKILQVIHGYPMRYNAGSEVYTQMLAHALAERHEVHIFTREEDPFRPDYALREEGDEKNPALRLHLVNNPRSMGRYRHAGIDARFAEVLDGFRPDVVHIGHLNHLSTSLVWEAADRSIPILFTLHDYWLMCPRGQFMQTHPRDGGELWASCEGQDNQKCAERCYARFFSGDPEVRRCDVQYWTDWIANRMRHIREMVELIDLFVAPSHYLRRRFVRDFDIPEVKIVPLDYGFDLSRLKGRERIPGEPFTFGYIGTHIPAKGIHHLIEAFSMLKGRSRLRIWGRERGQNTQALRAIADALPPHVSERIEWLPEYRNEEIVEKVFNRVDAIVVPSIWVENSPLVIHEALQCGVPVITADAGGMAEFIRHEVNGLVFSFRDPLSLAHQMGRFVAEPEFARHLGRRGYLASDDGSVPDMRAHAKAIEGLYERILSRRESSRIEPRRGPWRITFDTNPDTCNLRCVMCEDHSIYSEKKKMRREKRLPPRIMPISLIEKVVAEAAPLGLEEIIPSTMGEPLLYQEFDSIIDLCERHGVKLNLTTNGTFPRHGAFYWANRIVPVGSDVKISWNGSTKETHESIMVGTRWEKVLHNLEIFLRVRDLYAERQGHRCRVTLQPTFLESNVHELPELVKLAASLGIDRIKGHHLWVHFKEMESLSMRRSPESLSRWNEVVRRAREAAHEHRLPNGKQVLLDNIFELDPGAVDDLAPGGPCPFLGKEAWINPEGRFDPCCAPDEKRRTLGTLGNLHESSLADIWNGEAYRHLVRTYRTRSLCLSCNMRRPVEVAV